MERTISPRPDQTDRVESIFARRVDQSRNRSSHRAFLGRPAGPGEGQVGIKKPYQGHLEEGGLARARGGRDDPHWRPNLARTGAISA